MTDINHYTDKQLLALCESVLPIARQAGAIILDIYANTSKSTINVTEKSDKTPLTQADTLSHDYIFRSLKQLTPQLPVLSEEGVLPSFDIRKNWREYWLIDPLDGTKEFIARNGEFTVNIALIQNNKPVLGVVFAPALEQLFWATADGGAWIQTKGLVKPLLACKSQPPMIKRKQAYSKIIRVAASRHHLDSRVQEFLDKYIDKWGEADITQIGSSLKFCLIAQGLSDIYPRFGSTCEWDTAAGQVIVEQVGGAVLDHRGQPLNYNNKPSIINDDFVVVRSSEFNWHQFRKL